jgi:VCBS repeat-containing protein
LGVDTFTYQLHAGNDVSNVATVSITVTNAAPVAVNDSYEVIHDQPFDSAWSVLANDSDADGDPLTAVLVGGPSHGTLTLNSDGTFAYVPNPGFLGADSFTYEAQDPFTVGNVATVSLDVYDPGSVARNDVYSVTHDHTLSIAAPGVLGNDGGPGSGPLTPTLVSSTAYGSLTFNADGSFIYVPNPGFIGDDGFTYQDSDGLTTSGVAAVTLHVTNTAPVAAADSYQVSHDRALNVSAAQGLLANDSDADGDALSAVLVTSPADGSLTLNADGSFSYLPNPRFVGNDSFSYEASDGLAASAPATVSITVTNAAPVAADETVSAIHDRTLTVDAAHGVLAADSDADGDVLAASLVSTTSYGALSFNSDGSFSYQPNPGFVGADSFSYTASDWLATSNVATVTIDVVNHAPHAFNAAYAVHHDTTLVVTAADGALAGDSDPDGDLLTAVLVTGPGHGTLSLASDGSFSYVPAAGFAGSDQFSYTASDGLAASALATVTINVTNQPVVAAPDSYEMMHDTTLTVAADSGVLSNDVDDDGDVLTASVLSQPASGTLAFNADGSFSYTPNPHFSGTDSFTHRVGDGVSSDTATVTLTVDDPPPVVRGDEFWVLHDGMISVAAVNGILANDNDPSGETITPTIDTRVSHGTLALAADGGLVYRPSPGYLGDDSFTYHVNDAELASGEATVTIHVTDQAPTAADEEYSNVHGQTLTVGASSGVLSDAQDDDGDPLSAVLVQSVTYGALTLNADGSFVYAPKPGFQGTDSFTYVANDGAMTSDTMTVTLDVTDSAPQATDASYTLRHDTTLTVSAAAGLASDVSDADAGDTTTVALVAPANNGTVTLAADGSFVYVPNPGFAGTDTFTYDATDGMLTSDVATVALTVANDRPTSVADSYSVLHDHTLTVSAAAGVLANDVSGDQLSGGTTGDALTATLIAPPSYGTLTFNADGSFVYVPDAGFTGPDQFAYRAQDGVPGQGGLAGNVTDVSIDVSDQAPLAAALGYTVNQDQTLTVSAAAAGVLSAAGDPDGDAMTAVLAGGASHGGVTIAADGSFTYTPDPGYTGSDSFTVVADDGILQSAPATITIAVEHVYQPPAVPAQTFSVHAGATLADDMLTPATEDPTSPPLTAQLVTGVGHGTLTLNADGSFSYVPAPGFVGQDSFTATASDGTSTSAAATITIDVTNTPPVAQDRDYTAYLTTPLIVNAAAGVLATASDADGDPLTGTLVTNVSNGSLAFNSDGSFTYTANPGFTGTDTFTFQANDPYSSSAPATVVIHVTSDTVIARPDSYTVLHDRTLTVTTVAGVLRNDWDQSGASLSVQLVTATSHGTLTLAADGSFSYTPDLHFVGADQFSYQDSDGTSTSQPVIDTINVTDHAPVAQPDSYSVLHDHALVVGVSRGVLVNDYDDDVGDVIAAQLVSTTSHGSLSFLPDGSFIYDPNAGYVGDDSFEYVAGDGTLVSSPTSVTISVTDNAPVGQNAAYTIHHGQTLSVAAPGVLAFDYDYDLDPLSIVLVSTTTFGSLNLNPDGSFTYTPTKLAGGLDFVGLDSFVYKLWDGAEFSNPIAVTINVTDNPPKANPDFHAVHFGSPVGGNVLTNDVEADGDPLEVVSMSNPANGSVVWAADGSFTYTPTAPASGQPAFVGTDRFNYVETDGAALVTGTVTVDERDNAPHAYADLFTTPHGTALSGANVLANDWDPDSQDTLTAWLVSGPAHAASGFSLAANGAVTYTPAANFVGIDSFSYRDFDGAMWSSVVTVTIRVTNDPPHAVNDFFTAAENTQVTGNVLANDLSPDGDPLTATLIAGPTGATLSSNGDFTYTPPLNFTGAQSFTYQVSDGFSTDLGTITVGIMSVAINAMDDDYSFDRNVGTFSVNAGGGVLANDYKSVTSITLTASLVTAPTHGTLTLSSDGSFQYQPQPHFVGIDTFVYAASGAGLTDQATVTLKVTDQAPVAQAETLDDTENTPLPIPTGGVFSGGTVTVVSQPRHGLLNANPVAGTQFNYVPTNGFYGTDSFTYTLTDDVATVSNPAIVTINVARDVDPVTAKDDTDTVYENKSVPIDVLANDTAGDGPLQAGTTVSLATAPVNGTAYVSGAGQVVYTPNQNWFVKDWFTYTDTDPQGNTSTATVTVTVFSVNTPPAPTDINVDVTQGDTIDIDMASGTDDNGLPLLSGFDPRYVEPVTVPQHGTLTRTGPTSFNFYSDPSWSYDNKPGTESFEYLAYDSDWAAGPVKTVYINVTPIDHPPNFVYLRQAAVDAPVSFDVLAASTDPDPSDNGNLSVIQGNPFVVNPPQNLTSGWTDVTGATVKDTHGGQTNDVLVADIEAPPTHGDPLPSMMPPQSNPAVIQVGQTYEDFATGIIVMNGSDDPITVRFGAGLSVGGAGPTSGNGDPTAYILDIHGASHVMVAVSGAHGDADLCWGDPKTGAVPATSLAQLWLSATGNVTGVTIKDPDTGGQVPEIRLSQGNLAVHTGLNVKALLAATNIIVFARHDLEYPVKPSQDVYISASGNVPDVEAGGNVYTVWTDGSIGKVKAGGLIGEVIAGADITNLKLPDGSLVGSIKAAGDIGVVWADNIDTDITSTGGNIGFGWSTLTLPQWFQMQISMSGSWGELFTDEGGLDVNAHDVIAGSIDAKSGNINAVLGGVIGSPTIHAHGGIAAVRASKGEIVSVSIVADTGNIPSVQALWQIQDTTIQATAGNIGVGTQDSFVGDYANGVYAAGMANDTVVAGQAVYRLYSFGNLMASTVKGAGYVGDIIVEGDIDATITSGGDLRQVAANLGDLTGTITASGNLTFQVSAGHDVQAAVNVTGSIGNQLNPGNPAVVADRDIVGAITATGDISLVQAGRTLLGAVKGRNIQTVTAGLDVVQGANITATANLGLLLVAAHSPPTSRPQAISARFKLPRSPMEHLPDPAPGKTPARPMA